MTIFDSPNLVYVHLAPPCGTASRAREIRRSKHDPKPARSEAFPDCVPDLSRTDPVLHKRVMLANALYRLTGELFREVHRKTSYLRTPPTHLPCLQSVFDHCQYGGLKPKSTLLKHNMPNLSRLNQRCDGSHQHAAWGRIGAQWATAEATAYPSSETNYWSSGPDHCQAPWLSTSAQPSRSLSNGARIPVMRLTGPRELLPAGKLMLPAPSQVASRLQGHWPFSVCKG